MDCLLVCGEVMEMVFDYGDCRNFNLEFTNNASACKVVGPKEKLRSHISCSWECRRV